MKGRIFDFILGVLEMAFGIWILKQESHWYIGHIIGIALTLTGGLQIFAALTISNKDRDKISRMHP